MVCSLGIDRMDSLIRLAWLLFVPLAILSLAHAGESSRNSDEAVGHVHGTSSIVTIHHSTTGHLGHSGRSLQRLGRYPPLGRQLVG